MPHLDLPCRPPLVRLLALLLATLGLLAPGLASSSHAAPEAEARAAMTVDQFVSTYKGKSIDVDGYAGAQCVDLFNLYHQKVMGGSYVRMNFSGGAKDLWRSDNNGQVNDLYIRISKTSAARKGDVAVWGGYSDGFTYTDYGHVAMVLANTGTSPSSVSTFTQNPGAAHVETLSTKGLLGFLRPKKFALFSTAAPTVTGTARVGSTLTASTGSWSLTGVSLGYRWLANGTPISGATARTYVPTAGTVGKKLQVQVIASRSGYNTATATSAATAAVAPGTFSNTARPSVTGNPLVGSTLTANPGAWSPTPESSTYQWYADGVAISGATGSQWVVGSAQEGAQVTVRQVAARAGYTSAVAESTPVGPVTGASQLTPGSPALQGAAELGRTLTVAPGTWEPAPVDLTYQWFRGDQPIAGATSTTYTLRDEDVDQRIRAEVTGRRTGYAPATRSTAATTPVTAKTLTSSQPVVQGSATVGSTLTADPGVWGPDGVVLSVEWLRDGTPIGSARQSTYVVTSEDAGRNLAARVTGRLTGYRTVTQTSTPHAVPVQALTTATPTISGTARQGQTLTVKTDGWTAGTSFAYRWMREGATISGATGSTYRPVEADLGKRLSVAVTGSKTGYTSATRTSGSTAAVASMRGDTLAAGASLANGEALYASNYKYKAVQQTDGNFVVYNISGAARAIWSSKTNGKGAARIAMQTDGNLVQYTSAGKAVWATGTNGRGGTRLRMQTDGNLVMYTASGTAVWATGTNGK